MVATVGWRGGQPGSMIIVPTEAVVRVAAVGDTSVFVTAGGKLYLGHYNGTDRGSLHQVHLGSRCVRDAAVYRGEVVFVTDTGEVLAREIEGDGGEVRSLAVLEPKKTCAHGCEERGRRVRVRALAAGRDHILFLSTNDEIWVQGRGPALGLFTNKVDNEITNPARVDFFKGRRVLQVEAGSYFTAVLVEPLPPLHPAGEGGTAGGEEEVEERDYDSLVRTCEQCCRETGDRILFHDTREADKCPLGLGLRSGRRPDLLWPAGANSCQCDGRSSRTSGGVEDGESSGGGEDLAPTSGEASCDGTALSSPAEGGPHQARVSCDFEVVECGEEEEEGEGGGWGGKGGSSNSLFINADAARQFISRQLSWMTSSGEPVDSDEDSPLPTTTTTTTNIANNNKTHIDSATELIKENVASAATSAASLVATGVRTVSHKVGQLSRHFSSSEGVEGELHDLSPDTDPLDLHTPHTTPVCKMSKSESYECNSLPRCLSDELTRRKTHIRTGSWGLGPPRPGSEATLGPEKGPEQVAKNAKLLIDGGRHILNTEMWTWGSASRGQLGLGDLNHRSTPSCVSALNHMGVTKIVCGSHHAAALTIDGQVFVWGDNSDGQGGPSPPTVAASPSNKSSSKSSPAPAAAPQPLITSPRLLELPGGRLARDVAAGDNYLVVVSLDGLVYYVGRLREGEGSTVEQVTVGDAATRCRSVLCQCDTVVCTTDTFHSQVLEFIKLEAEYLRLLKSVVQLLVKPLLAACPPTTTTTQYPATTNPHPPVGEAVQRTKRRLLELYRDLTQATATALSDLLDDPALDLAAALPIICQAQELKHIYQQYIGTVCDALAVGGLSLTNRESLAVLDRSQPTLAPLVPADQCRTSNDLFSYVLLRPLHRCHQHAQFLATLKGKPPDSYFSPFTLDKIKIAHAHWNQLSNFAHKSQAEAEVTRGYWESCSPRLAEALAGPWRRLLRDSRSCPITVHNASRFSTHGFVLLTDLLLHLHYSTFTTYSLSTMWVEALPNAQGLQNGLQLSMPEDTLTLTCPTSQDKAQWLHALQEGIKRAVLGGNDPGLATPTLPRAPPLVRSASYTFTKHPQYKEATYTGQWFCGKLHGEGQMVWGDGRRYEGQFKQSVFHGAGRLYTPSSAGITVHEGTFKNGKLEGRGVIKYTNKDVYMGNLREGLPHGHGELKKGRFSSQAACVYTGEWSAGLKHGYGVLDDIAKGEKYLGMWQQDMRQGPGMVVTMNGVYYEGTFHQNKLTGTGLMMFEDHTYYEGELGAGGTFAGRGTLHYPGGDTIEGTFSGSWEDGIKLNGVLHKPGLTPPEDDPTPRFFGKLSVGADHKWSAVVQQCREQLGLTSTQVSTAKVWETLASRLEGEKQAWKRQGGPPDLLEGLDRIPDSLDPLTHVSFLRTLSYLGKALESPVHPLGQLLQALVDAFRATYGGVVAHPRLLPYAVQEVRSFTSRLYELSRVLFPCLPAEGDQVLLEPDTSDQEEIVVTPGYVIHPWLLPHVYSPLSTLYVLQHQHKDEEYWRRLLKWNKQPDTALMTFLGVDVKFWLPEGWSLVESSRALGSVKDQHFTEAIETLQMLSTSFTPRDKLQLIHRTFQLVTKAVTVKLGTQYLWSMDDLFPVFQYVVVRSRIQHLGAEIQLVDDLLDPHLQHGELGIMFTTLRACYYQIQNEKLTHLM